MSATTRDLDGIRRTPRGTLLFVENLPLGKRHEMSFGSRGTLVAVDVRLREQLQAQLFASGINDAKLPRPCQ